MKCHEMPTFAGFSQVSTAISSTMLSCRFKIFCTTPWNFTASLGSALRMYEKEASAI